MKLLEKWPENTMIERWNKQRALLNSVIEKFNLWQLSVISANEAFTEFAMKYMEFDKNGVDYSEDYDIMIEEFNKEGFDTSFYKRF